VTLLAIETATDTVAAALLRDDGGVAERIHEGGRAHAELLAPCIEEVCAVSGCDLAEIEAIAVDIGPGLFTGLRVGVATAKALAQALGIGVLGVGSLDVLAAAALDAAALDAATLDAAGPVRPGPAMGAVASVVDARRGEVFAAVYRFERGDGDAGGAGPAPIEPIDLVDPETVRQDRMEPMAPAAMVEWLLAVAAEAGTVSVVGDGAVRYRGLLGEQRAFDLSLADAGLRSPPPAALLGLARRRLDRGVATLAPSAVVPDYRRPADAQINWEQRPSRPVATSTGGSEEGTPG
jgi:tRNA threonylcarbamoyladenosine biosynthesis protein TsaB